MCDLEYEDSVLSFPPRSDVCSLSPHGLVVEAHKSVCTLRSSFLLPTDTMALHLQKGFVLKVMRRVKASVWEYEYDSSVSHCFNKVNLMKPI